MADKEKKEDSKDKDEKKEGAAPAAAESGSKKLAIMAGIVAANLLIVVVLTVVLVNHWKPKDPAVLEAATKQKEEEAEREKQTKMGETLKDPIVVVVNLAGNSDRFLKASLVLEYEPKEGAKGGGEGEGEKGGGGDPEIMKRLPKIKAIAIEILSTKTAEELADLDGKRKILTQLKNEMNKIFPEPETIKNIYFSDFIIQ